jgi:DNA-binding MarR family transcriptional regulator
MIFGDRPPAALADYTGFLMNWVGTRSRRHFTHALEESCGLHPRDFGVLSVVASNPGITQQALGESAGVDPSTMVATLDMLEERGLAERRPHPEDRRKRAVHLTAEGKQVLRQGRRVAAAAAREVFEPLTPEERKQLHALLLKLSGLTGDSG